MGNTIGRATGTQAPTGVGAPSEGGSKLNLDHLSQSNPKIAQLIKENPGLGKLLERNTVSSGPRAGEVKTEVSWEFWTHSEKTNKKYGHGMTDKQITSDYIVAFQPSPVKGASVNLGNGAIAGHEIIGVYKAGDHIPRKNTAYDGGHLGEFDLKGHGEKGKEAVMGWAIITVTEDGNVRGGGYPTMRGGKLVPYQDQKGEGGGGGEYWGRAARVTHGQTNNYVPITDN